MSISGEHVGANGTADCADHAVPVAMTATVRYRDAFGHMQEIRVTSTMARAIRTVFQQAKYADKRWREKHETFTDLDIVTEKIVAQLETRPSQAGNPWQGPRFDFSTWIGEGRIWPGPQWVGTERTWPVPEPKRARKCDFCRGAWLGVETYCLRCNRSGRDREIPRPSRTELSRIRSPKDDGLKGGK